MGARPGTKSTAPAPKSTGEVRSYFRSYAEKCQTAAQNASAEKQRAELGKMVRVWREFAEKHEQMVRNAGADHHAVTKRRAIPGWM